MLRTNFEIFKGIGPGTVKKIHNAGLLSWQDAIESPEKLPVGKKRKTSLLEEIRNAKEQYEMKNLIPLEELLKPKATWALYSSFAEQCVLFDIETTGLSPEDDEITIISTYRPATREFRSFVRGDNLDDFPSSMQSNDIMVGFNNRAFDTPFIRAEFGSRLSSFAQIDLRWVLHGMGIKGKLKNLEREEFGIERPYVLQGFSGWEAINTWYKWWENGDEDSLSLLLYYGAADTYVLDYIAREVCRRNGCKRFAEKIDASVIFKGETINDWSNALPQLPPPNTSELIDFEMKDESAEEEEEKDRIKSEHYMNVFLMALADEDITSQERRILDLFASKYGLSYKKQKEIEQAAVAIYEKEQNMALVNRVVSMGSEWRVWYLEELTIFCWVDGTLDRREREVLGKIAGETGLSEKEIHGLKEYAAKLGDQLCNEMS